MIQYFVSLLVVLVLYVIYTWWIRPMRIIRGYVKHLKDRGYKVLHLKYNPFQIDMITQIRKGIKQGDALKYFKEQRSKYDVIVSNSFNRPRVQIVHIDFLKDFFSVDKHYMYPKSPKVVEIFSRIAGFGLPFSEGQAWDRKRRILNKVFNFDFVKSQTSKIAKNCEYSIKEMEKMGRKDESQNSVTYNVIQLTVKMFSSVMMESFLGGTKEQVINGQPAGQFLKSLLDDISLQRLKPIGILGSKFLQMGITESQRKTIHKLQVYRAWGLPFIRNRIVQVSKKLKENNDIDSTDIVSALIKAKFNAKADSEENMVSEQEIFEEFSTFMAAGTDTTSIFVAMIIYSIAKNPEIQRKVREQIGKYMNEEDYSLDNLKNFNYLEMLQKQVTRYYGPGVNLFARVAKNDNYLNGLPIKKGTNVCLNPICNNFNPQYFPNPFQFRPERWESQCNDLPGYINLGFSAGARTCIGKHLAWIQSKIAVIKFMKRYSKIILGKQNFKMIFRFLYTPEDFESKMFINNDYKL